MIALGDGRGISDEQIGNVMVHRILKRTGVFQKLLFPFVAFFAAKRLHHDRPYDAVWAIMASYAGYAGALFKKKYPEIPLVLTIQEGDHFGRREGVLQHWFRKIFRAADHIQAISDFLADWSRAMGALCPIRVVPNGVDFDNFSHSISLDRRNELRTGLGFSSEDVILVTASRLVYKNAVDDVISALAYLDPSCKALILGSGQDEAKLKREAARLKLNSRVVFKGFVPHAELPRYLQASDIFVRPSRSEGLGNSFLEAMAAGIPVIATAVGGIPDFLTDGETGLFCDVDDPRSIAQKAEKLLRDAESRDYIVRRAREMVRDRYGWQRIAAEMQEIFAVAV
jgi:glycosyltransferase involved in cell wall biosynthesis